MPDQITLEEALKLVSFQHEKRRGWQVLGVYGTLYGDVKGTVHVAYCREWESVETPKDKLQRFIEESGNQELIDAFNQMENN